VAISVAVLLLAGLVAVVGGRLGREPAAEPAGAPEKWAP
jgi:hypothetical protein